MKFFVYISTIMTVLNVGHSVEAASTCQAFQHANALQQRATFWQDQFASMPKRTVVGWIIGINNPMLAAKTEAQQQLDCLLKVIADDIQVKLPHGANVYSGLRSYNRQSRIWERKFFFEGRPFDRVSASARSLCSAHLTEDDILWDPRNMRHRLCWLGQVRQTKAILSIDQRQAEILQASSAPGISRHHWGTDFDIFDSAMNPKNWQDGGHLRGAYNWLNKNASTYGFFQPYDADQLQRQPSYMEEGWHWSYYPVAHALLDYAKKNKTFLARMLSNRWRNKPQYQYIMQHWQDFMFNINGNPVW